MPNRIFWTRQAQEDLREVRAFIARDAPATASAFVRRLRQSVERLRMFPCSGQIVPELGRADIRELLKGDYRIIYRVAEHRTWRFSPSTIALVYWTNRTSDTAS